MKLIRSIIAMAAALATAVGYAGDSAPFRLDTTEGTRVARAEEVITYSTEWDNAGKVIVAVDGVTLKEASAPVSGDVTWNARNASAGNHTLTHTAYKNGVADKVESVTFTVKAIYTVTFNANGGSLGSNSPTRSITEGNAVGTLPTPTRTGYTFAGWWTAASGGTQISASTTVTGNVTYYAHWTVKYTVTFNANGGTGGKSGKQDYGSAIVAPTVTREWFTFTGWSPAVAATVPANDVTYTAQWARWGDTISASKMGRKTMRELYPSDYATMTTIVLEEGITELPAGFFDGCDNVEDLTLPESLREFGIDDLPPKIRASLAYDENGFMIYNGWILDYQNRNASEVTIPEGVVGIGRGAFKEMFDLETVTMPESLKYIASGAFEDCSWIQNLQFMSGLRYVGQEAFRGCSSLLGASFADGVEHIGANAFKDCWQMTSVRLPYTVAYIGDGAFTGCSAILGVTVPTHLKTMQNLFPASYSQIGTAEVAEGETTVMDDMFKGCVALRGGATQTDMSMIPNTVTNIGARAFQGCTSLTAFVVPDSVVKIGASVFQGCTSLWNVTLSRSLTEIPDYAFYGCSMLETMVVPEGVAYLGNRFFSGKYRGDNALYYLCANAPDYHSGAYAAIAGNMTTYVLQDSRSWDGRQGSRVLPQSWNGYDITYWTPNRFDVTFDANGGRFDSMGGSTWSEQQITDMTYALPSTEPVRPGWAFEGWWTEQTGGAEVRYTTLVTATRTHTLYAHWRSLGNKMTVTFNSNGGTVVTPGTQDYVPGQTFGQFPVPTRRGYTFQGWWTEAVNGIRMTEATQVPAADMELFAHWKPIAYYVRFHANGGTGTMSDQPFTFDVSGALKTHAFTRTGFAFTGWATTPSGQVRYAENKTVVNLEEVDGHIVDLYAVWSGVGYSVRFDSNGGTGIMDNQTIAVGETQNLWPCAFARSGYTFAGWALSPTDAEAKKVTYRDGQAVRNLATSNGATVPLYAVWVTGSQTVRITFDANGGSVSPTSRTVAKKATVGDLPTPVRTGYAFVGWFTAESGGTQITSATRVTANVTYYAHWVADGSATKCTVIFDVNGNGMLSHHEENPRTVVKNAAVGELPTPMVPNLADSGFGEFLGWFTAKTGGAQISADTIVTKDVTYYAHWKYFRYVVLDANGGELPDEYWWPFIENGAPVDSLPDASRPGYTFDGWYTAASGGTRVSAATKITATASNIREPVKYYAHWKEAVSFPGIATWKFYEEADDDEGLNLAAWEDWSAVDVPFWIGEGICMAIPVEGNFTADDVVLVSGTYSDYGHPQIVSDEWMFAKHCTALEKAVGYDPYEDDEYDQGAYGLVFEDDVKGRNYSLSMDIWPEKRVVSGRQWILLEMGGNPTKGCKTFYLGVKGRDEVGYSRFSIYATPDQGVSQNPSNWSNQRELAVLPVPIGSGTVSGSGMYASGTRVSLSAKPNVGYEFAGWYDQYNGRLIGASANLSYATTGVNKTVFARFRQKSAPTPTPTPTPGPEEPPALFESVDGVAPLAAASEYNGYLYDEKSGAVKGTIQVKVGKANAKTGLAAVKATVVGLDGKKKSLKGAEKGKVAIAVDGPTTIRLVGGESCEVTLGAEGLSGTYGSYFIDGARNFFTSKDKGEQNAANAILSKWLGVINVAWREDGAARSASAPYQMLSVTIGKKGKAKVYVTLANGTKAMVNTQLLIGEEWLCVPVVVTKKMNLVFTLWLPVGGGAAVVDGLPGDVVVGKAGALKAGAKFRIDAEAFSARWGQRALPYLPDGVAVTANGTRWTLPKAGKVQMAKDGTVDEAKLGGNPAALKLTYKAKDGSFKGSFKAYSLVNGKPKAVTVNVAGVVVDGVGYGTATVKKVGSVPISIE